jgi:hypothetical protein
MNFCGGSDLYNASFQNVIKSLRYRVLAPKKVPEKIFQILTATINEDHELPSAIYALYRRRLSNTAMTRARGAAHVRAKSNIASRPTILHLLKDRTEKLGNGIGSGISGPTNASLLNLWRRTAGWVHAVRKVAHIPANTAVRLILSVFSD